MKTVLLTFLLASFATLTTAQWVQTNGPLGGIVTSFVRKGPNLFVSTVGGVFRSTDNGGSWKKMNKGLTDITVRCLITNGNDVYCGTNGGVFQSTDDGVSWANVSSGLNSKVVYSLMSYGTTLFAGTFGGTYTTLTNSKSWQLSTSGIPSITCLAFGTFGISIFAGTSQGLYQTTDTGATWIKLGNGIPIDVPIASLASFDSIIFAVSSYGIHRSIDTGKSWLKADNGVNALVTTLASQPGFVYAGTVDSGIYILTPNSDIWWNAYTGISGTRITTIFVDYVIRFAGTNGSGIFAHLGGPEFLRLNDGLVSSYISSLLESENTLYAGGFGGVFRTTDMGSLWKEEDTLFRNLQVLCLAKSESGLFAGTYGGGVYFSSDNGIHWEAINKGIEYLSVSSIAVNPQGLYAATSNGLFLSTDNGATWTPYNNGLPSSSLYSILATGTDLFIGTSQGVFLSTNNGASWASASGGLLFSLTVNALLTNGIKLFAATSGGIYTSIDKGATWTVLPAFNSGNAKSLLVTDSIILAAYPGAGIFSSTDNGNTKNNVSSGLDNLFTYSLSFLGEDVYAATAGSGVWKRKVSEITNSSGVEEATLMKSMPFSSNAPNPASTQTTISFTIPSRAMASLEVFDQLGRSIDVLASGIFEAGSYNRQLDVSALPSNVYFYKFQVGNTTEMKQFIVVH